MSRIFQVLFIVLLTSSFVRAQFTLGLHNGYSSYVGLYHELALEAPVYKGFSLNTRFSYAINRGSIFRTGISYSISVLQNTSFRFGLDLGSFLESDRSRNNFKRAYYMTGLNMGIHQKIGKNWGILGELGYMNMTSENRRWLSTFPQIGVTYQFNKK